MATITPTVKPRVKLPTAQTHRKYYTIHSNNNNAFSLKLNDNVRTAIVGFKDADDAVRIGSMIETHFIQHKEWPETREPGQLILPSNRLQTLSHIFIRVWAFDDLKFECTNNFLDFISVESIVSGKPESYSLNGNFYSFQAPEEFYQNRIRELYDMA
jgi:hypothetical protein